MTILAVLGCGLIGASIARGARARGLADTIVVVDPDPEVRRLAGGALRLADVIVATPAELPVAPDLAAVAAPPARIAEALIALAPRMASGGVMFDTGSIKGAIVANVAGRLGGTAFVPAHPIAGTERSGPEAGFGELFAGRWCVLTPQADLAPSAAVARVAAFWSGLGAQVAEMSPEDHDALLAATSHAPHLVAYALTTTATDPETGDVREDVVRFSAGGFRDFTRIAASDPAMWRDVFLLNRDAALAALDRVTAELAALRAAVAAGDGPALEARFAAGRAVRAAIVAAGQETTAPDFGRPRPTA